MAKAEPDAKVIYGDLLATILMGFSRAWMVMLLFGVLHASARQVPAFGYWQSLFVTAVLWAIAESANLNVLNRLKTLTPLYGKKSPSTDQIVKMLTDLAKKGTP